MTPGSPKYHQIVNRILTGIRRGQYGVGELLPTEHRLMTAYGVSRHTVRQAMQSLKQMGVIQVHQGKGSVVVSKPDATAFIEKIPSLEAIVDMGADLNRRLLKKLVVIADGELAGAFGCETGREFLEMHFVRNLIREPEVPTVFLKVWVDPVFGSISDFLEFEGGTTRDAMVDVLKRHFEFETGAIRQTVSACTIDDEAASVLNLPVGGCALKIERRYYQSPVLLPHLRSISVCRGDLLRIESHFQAN